ncbi:MAG: hypothetical protein ACXAHE_12335 [Roseburia sp. 1XD42-69]
MIAHKTLKGMMQEMGKSKRLPRLTRKNILRYWIIGKGFISENGIPIALSILIRMEWELL